MIKRPSPALVVAALALFLALVGSGFAATSGHVGAHKRKPKHTAALTAAGVNKLIGAYLRHHRIAGRRGATGRTGATGAAGQTGAQGPGAKQIAVFIHGPRTPFPIATIGPWTVRMDCTVGVSANITGPGTFFASTNTGTAAVGALAAETATTKVQTSPLGAGGFTANTTNGSGMSQRISTDVQPISGSTMEELHLQLTANPVSGDPNSDCSVTGSATPVK